MASKQHIQQAVVIYKPKVGGVDFRVQVEKETVWLSLDQIAQVFGRDKSVVSRHIKNIFTTKELDKRAVVAIFATTAADGKTYQVEYFNLDLILSVGYRVNSKQATAFRIWATTILKKYLLDGYAVNERRIQEAQRKFLDLQDVVQLLSTKVSADKLRGQEQELFSLLKDYAKTLTVLEQYDQSILATPKGTKTTYKLTYEDMVKVLNDVRIQLIEKGEGTDLFARERDGSFEGIINGLYQSVGGKELYKGIEQKAAHLLYFTIKDHPFSDGNKRSAAFLFVYFLNKNSALYKESGERKINDNALAALALLVAESDPKEKETMVKFIANLIAN